LWIVTFPIRTKYRLSSKMKLGFTGVSCSFFCPYRRGAKYCSVTPPYVLSSWVEFHVLHASIFANFRPHVKPHLVKPSPARRSLSVRSSQCSKIGQAAHAQSVLMNGCVNRVVLFSLQNCLLYTLEVEEVTGDCCLKLANLPQSCRKFFIQVYHMIDDSTLLLAPGSHILEP
jgi:hypothetical protein